MGRMLSEHESKRLVAEFGVPVVQDQVVRSPAEAVTAAEQLGYPAVVKVAEPTVAHKTERGFVRLALPDASAVEEAATELLATAGPEPAKLLVAPMVRGSRELIAGAHRDRQFGPCVMVGIGGTHAEAVADVSFGVVPIDAVDALDMLEALHGQALLGALRGEPPLDRQATAGALLGLSRLMNARDDVAAVDVNPLVVVEGAPIAVDALVELVDHP